MANKRKKYNLKDKRYKLLLVEWARLCITCAAKIIPLIQKKGPSTQQGETVHPSAQRQVTTQKCPSVVVFKAQALFPSLSSIYGNKYIVNDKVQLSSDMQETYNVIYWGDYNHFGGVGNYACPGMAFDILLWKCCISWFVVSLYQLLQIR